MAGYLLASLYERILVPLAVHREVTVAGRGLPGAEEERNALPRLSAFYWILGHGKRARVKVKTVFRGDNDDESLTIWTPFGDCGYDFQKGETYLIYAAFH